MDNEDGDANTAKLYPPHCFVSINPYSAYLPDSVTGMLFCVCF